MSAKVLDGAFGTNASTDLGENSVKQFRHVLEPRSLGNEREAVLVVVDALRFYFPVVKEGRRRILGGWRR